MKKKKIISSILQLSSAPSPSAFSALRPFFSFGEVASAFSSIALSDSVEPLATSDVHPHFPAIIQDKDLLQKSCNDHSSGLNVLDLIDAGSLDPSAALYSSLIKRCTQFKKLREARLVHSHLSESEFRSDVFLHNSIVNMYCKCRSLDDARRAFDEMPEKDTVSWTILITGYAQNDRPNEALEMFPRMLRLGLVPNEFTFASLLKACRAVAGDGHGEQLHALCVKYGCSSNVYVGSAVLDMYARSGKMNEACLVFDRLHLKNEVSWNSLIAAYSRNEDGEMAIRKFIEMQRSGFEASQYTYSSVFGACASVGALEKGKWVHAHMIKSAQKLTNFVGNTLIDMYAKAGSIEDARKVFDLMDKKDVVSWNSMLTGYAQHGFARETIYRFEEMRRHGVQPNQITFLCVLTACSHGGLLKEGQNYFEMMRMYNLEPEEDHYVSQVDLLGRAGFLDRAQKFISEMPIQPTAAVWGALLGACRMHKNTELGRIAAERIFELDPSDSGPRILLYNIYASSGKWDDAARVRKMMKMSGVKKKPACSWVEMGNSVHMFVADDESHPQIKGIRKMWEMIDGKIKESGYIPDTNYVLLHVEENERASKLKYHSEKLALAFALLNIPQGAPIRIMKNIRMCGDCHSAIKHVSKVVQRKIIVRDTNRFHHFSGGSCSCGDYW